MHHSSGPCISSGFLRRAHLSRCCRRGDRPSLFVLAGMRDAWPRVRTRQPWRSRRGLARAPLVCHLHGAGAACRARGVSRTTSPPGCHHLHPPVHENCDDALLACVMPLPTRGPLAWPGPPALIPIHNCLLSGLGHCSHARCRLCLRQWAPSRLGQVEAVPCMRG